MGTLEAFGEPLPVYLGGIEGNLGMTETLAACYQ